MTDASESAPTYPVVLVEAVQSWRALLALWGALLFAHDAALCYPALVSPFVKIFPYPIILSNSVSVSHSLLALVVAFLVLPEGLVREWPWGDQLAPRVARAQDVVGGVLRCSRARSPGAPGRPCRQFACALASLYMTAAFLMTELTQTKDHPYLGMYWHIRQQRFLGLWSLWVLSEVLCVATELSLRLLLFSCGCSVRKEPGAPGARGAPAAGGGAAETGDPGAALAAGGVVAEEGASAAAAAEGRGAAEGAGPHPGKASFEPGARRQVAGGIPGPTEGVDAPDASEELRRDSVAPSAGDGDCYDNLQSAGAGDGRRGSHCRLAPDDEPSASADEQDPCAAS